jgi:hypothetical protein
MLPSSKGTVLSVPCLAVAAANQPPWALSACSLDHLWGPVPSPRGNCDRLFVSHVSTQGLLAACHLACDSARA